MFRLPTLSRNGPSPDPGPEFVPETTDLSPKWPDSPKRRHSRAPFDSNRLGEAPKDPRSKTCQFIWKFAKEFAIRQVTETRQSSSLKNTLDLLLSTISYLLRSCTIGEQPSPHKAGR
jgi:hypothetical protein